MTEKAQFMTAQNIEAQGFRILRFWDNEVLREIEAVKEVIGETLSCRLDTPLLNPPPQGGRKFLRVLPYKERGDVGDA